MLHRPGFPRRFTRSQIHLKTLGRINKRLFTLRILDESSAPSPKRRLIIRLKTLDMSERAKNVIVQAKLVYLGELIQMHPDDVFKLRNSGQHGLPARATSLGTGGPSLGDQVEFGIAVLHVRRVKQGTPSTHPILGDELRALPRLQREQEPKSPFVFTSERGAPFSTAGFARMVERAGREATLAFKAHPHMLRHACGCALANRHHVGCSGLMPNPKCGAHPGEVVDQGENPNACLWVKNNGGMGKRRCTRISQRGVCDVLIS